MVNLKQIARAFGIALGLAGSMSCTPAAPASAPAAPAVPAPGSYAAADPGASSAEDTAWIDAVAAEAGSLRTAFPEATVRIAVLDATTGRVITREGPVDTAHAIGSTMKTLTVAAALDAGTTASTELDCSRPAMVAAHEVHDHAVHGMLTVKQVLARSSNVGTVRLAEQVGWRELYDRAARLAPLPDPATLQDGAGVHLLYGGTARMSTLELARAYAVLANGGRDPADGRTLVKPAAATEIIAMLRYAVQSEEGTGRAAAVADMEVAGKTGTAGSDEHQTALFVGMVGPAEARRVVAVAIEDVPWGQTGGTLAAPAFARIVAASAR